MNRGKTYESINYRKRPYDSQYGASMHDVLRLIITLDGEDVVDCEPILDYLATMFMEAITVNGPKQLGNIQVPKRASYIRVIMLELSRIVSHLLWLGPFMADIGIGVISGEEAINWGLSSPMLRAFRIKWDLQKVDHYECYDEFDWEIQWQKEGDLLAHYFKSDALIEKWIQNGMILNIDSLVKNLLPHLNYRDKNYMRE
ncbi:hypothetical protein Gotur_025411 [Gossypium turneri]